MGMNRTAVDYDTEESLRAALCSFEQNVSSTMSVGSCCVASNSPSMDELREVLPCGKKMDWVLRNFDSETSEAQSVKDELYRLNVLKSYLILDADRERAFDRITEMAERLFDVPIAVISLVDLGRQWFLSTRGLGECKETPREHAFCAHAILSKQDVFIVPNAPEDPRFCNNPLVTGGPNIRFYAGAPLISPEGYKLGTCCIISDKARPGGLNADEKKSLIDLAAMTVEALGDRRNRLQLRKYTECISYEAHCLLTPLNGIQLTLSLLAEDEGLRQRLSHQQLELLDTAASSSDLMISILKGMDNLQQNSADEVAKLMKSANGTSATTAKLLLENRKAKSKPSDAIQLSGADHSSASDTSNSSSQSSIFEESGNGHDPSTPITHMQELISSLDLVTGQMPKRVPLMIQLDPNVPKSIVAQDLILFRSALNLISSSVNRTEVGSIKLRIYQKQESPNRICFECTDTGMILSPQEQQQLFAPPQAGAQQGKNDNLLLCMYSVADMIHQIPGGCYGFHPYHKANSAAESTGSVFWFTVPLVLPPPSQLIQQQQETSFSERSSTPHNPKRLLNQASSSSLLPLSPFASDVGPIVIPKMVTIKPNKSPTLSQPTIPSSVFTTRNSTSSMSRTVPTLGQFHLGYNLSKPAFTLASRPEGLLFARPPSPYLALPPSTTTTEKTQPQQTSISPLFKLQPQASSSISPLFNQPLSSQQSQQVAISPCGVKDIVQQPTQQNKDQNKRTPRALVIDDSLVIRKTVGMALKKLGYEVTQAEDGLVGLNKMIEKPFDLVLCDFLMPVMDGLDCVKQYRAWEKLNRSWFNQLIVGISAHANEDVSSQGLTAGMDDFKPKPINIKVLKAVCESDMVVSKKKQLDEAECVVNKNDSSSSATTDTKSSDESDAAAPLGESSSQNKQLVVSSTTTNVSGEQQSRAKVKTLETTTLASPLAKTSAHGFYCLMASGCPPSAQCEELLRALRAHNWNIVSAQEKSETLRLLQQRNWDAVLMDEDMMGACQVMTDFRQWESKNRVNRQNNATFLVDLDIPVSPTDGRSFSSIHPPSGFDTVVRKANIMEDLGRVIQTGESSLMSIILEC